MFKKFNITFQIAGVTKVFFILTKQLRNRFNDACDGEVDHPHAIVYMDQKTVNPASVGNMDTAVEFKIPKALYLTLKNDNEVGRGLPYKLYGRFVLANADGTVLASISHDDTEN